MKDIDEYLKEITFEEKDINDINFTVYLIDEQHVIKGAREEFNEQSRKSTTENIKIAKLLLECKKVELIGVESHEGFFDNEDFKSGDIGQLINGKKSINDYPDFANGLIPFLKDTQKIVGVENENLFKACNSVQSMFEGDTRNPFYFCRTVFFLKALFDAYKRYSCKGNVILNCGSNHNADIFDIIGNGLTKEITTYTPNFKRLRNKILDKYS